MSKQERFIFRTMKKLDYPETEKKTCSLCEWFFMCGDEQKDGTCGKPYGGRNYCYPDDEACDDYEDPNDHTIDKELRMALPSARKDGENTCFGYAEEIGNGMRQWTNVCDHNGFPFVYGPNGERYVDGSAPASKPRVGMAWIITKIELDMMKDIVKQTKERVYQTILIRLFISKYEMDGPIHIRVEDCEIDKKKIIGTVAIKNYVQERR